MWYRDDDHPDGAYHRINSDQPLAFSDDETAGANPPVPMFQTYLVDTGKASSEANPWLGLPGGMFEFPIGSGTYWMTSFGQYGLPPIRIHQFRFDSSNALNPWTVSTPYRIAMAGLCSGCTSPACGPSGNTTLPARYKPSADTAVVYPLTSTTAIGYANVSLAACSGGDYGGRYSGEGLLPFTVGQVDFTATYGCSYAIGAVPSCVGAAGAAPVIPVTTTSDCGWSAGADVPWVTPTVGAGSVTLSIAVNVGAPRTAHVTVAGRTFTVSQAGSLNKPAGVTAKKLDAASIQVAWQAVSGATAYALQRRNAASGWLSISSNAVSPYIDTNLASGAAYAYRVVATDACGSTSAYSNTALGGTFTFTDEPLAGFSGHRGTTVKAFHVSELRTAVNAVRLTAGVSPQSYSYADPILYTYAQRNASYPRGTIVSATHINDLRTALNEALVALGVPAPVYTETLNGYNAQTRSRGTVVKKSHVAELRNVVSCGATTCP